MMECLRERICLRKAGEVGNDMVVLDRIFETVYDHLRRIGDETNEVSFNHFKKYVDEGRFLKAVCGSEKILKGALEGELKCVIYYIAKDKEGITLNESFKTLSELFRELDSSIKIEVYGRVLSYDEIGEDERKIGNKYSGYVLTPRRVGQLHTKIYEQIKDDDLLREKHVDETTAKMVVFERDFENSGVSCAREENEKIIKDYALCFCGIRDVVTWAHELGHKLGLMHVLDPHDIMYESSHPFSCIPIPRKFRKWSKKQWKYIKKRINWAGSAEKR